MILSRKQKIILWVAVLLVAFVTSCSNNPSEKAYLSKQMGYSFRYPYDFVIVPKPLFLKGEINHEMLTVQESFGVHLTINVIDIKNKIDMLPNVLPNRYRDEAYNLLKNENFVICSFDLGIAGYFKPYLIYMWWPVRPKNMPPVGKITITKDTELEKQRIDSKLALEVMKSFEFKERNLQNIVVIENDDGMRNIMLLMLKAADFYKKKMNQDEIKQLLEESLLYIEQQYKEYNKKT